VKTISKMGAQGDLLVRKIRKIPAKAEEVPAQAGRHVVAHSETGHHHYLDSSGVTLLRVPSDPLVCYLRIEGDWADVVHARPHDTHETIRLPRGDYETRRQREYTPRGWRRVED
jgi:hypothetical protein